MTVEQAARDFFGWFNRHYPAPSTNPDHEWNRLGVALVNHQEEAQAAPEPAPPQRHQGQRRAAVTDCQTTHAAGCWSCGPKHYECAVGQIERDEALLRQAPEVSTRFVYADLRPQCESTIDALRARLGRYQPTENEGSEP